MERLNSIDTLVIQQKKEWGEIITGFEARNKYSVKSASGEEVYFAAEESSVMLRLFLKTLRPLTLHVLSSNGTQVLRLKRPFRLFFHRMEVVDSQGKLLGSIQKKFSFMRRIYSILDPAGNEMFYLFGPILHPWTFNIFKNGTEIGKITKKWSGLMKEQFTDADNFAIQFPMDLDIQKKSVLLGAVFLIDLVHFEK